MSEEVIFGAFYQGIILQVKEGTRDPVDLCKTQLEYVLHQITKKKTSQIELTTHENAALDLEIQFSTFKSKFLAVMCAHFFKFDLNIIVSRFSLILQDILLTATMEVFECPQLFDVEFDPDSLDPTTSMCLSIYHRWILKTFYLFSHLNRFTITKSLTGTEASFELVYRRNLECSQKSLRVLVQLQNRKSDVAVPWPNVSRIYDMYVAFTKNTKSMIDAFRFDPSLLQSQNSISQSVIISPAAFCSEIRSEIIQFTFFDEQLSMCNEFLRMIDFDQLLLVSKAEHDRIVIIKEIISLYFSQNAVVEDSHITISEIISKENLADKILHGSTYDLLSIIESSEVSSSEKEALDKKLRQLVSEYEAFQKNSKFKICLMALQSAGRYSTAIKKLGQNTSERAPQTAKAPSGPRFHKVYSLMQQLKQINMNPSLPYPIIKMLRETEDVPEIFSILNHSINSQQLDVVSILHANNFLNNKFEQRWDSDIASIHEQTSDISRNFLKLLGSVVFVKIDTNCFQKKYIKALEMLQSLKNLYSTQDVNLHGPIPISIQRFIETRLIKYEILSLLLRDELHVVPELINKCKDILQMNFSPDIPFPLDPSPSLFLAAISYLQLCKQEEWLNTNMNVIESHPNLRLIILLQAIGKVLSTCTKNERNSETFMNFLNIFQANSRFWKKCTNFTSQSSFSGIKDCHLVKWFRLVHRRSELSEIFIWLIVHIYDSCLDNSANKIFIPVEFNYLTLNFTELRDQSKLLSSRTLPLEDMFNLILNCLDSHMHTFTNPIFFKLRADLHFSRGNYKTSLMCYLKLANGSIPSFLDLRINLKVYDQHVLCRIFSCLMSLDRKTEAMIVSQMIVDKIIRAKANEIMRFCQSSLYLTWEPLLPMIYDIFLLEFISKWTREQNDNTFHGILDNVINKIFQKYDPTTKKLNKSFVEEYQSKILHHLCESFLMYP